MPKKKTHREFVEEVYKLFKNDYVFLEEYNGALTKIKVKHNIPDCGNEYRTTPSEFLRRRSNCPECSGRKTNEQFKREVFDLVKKEYTFLQKYKKANTKIQVIHNNCGTIYEVRPSDFLRGSRCLVCAREKQRKNKSKRTLKTHEQFKQEVEELVGEEYEFIERYMGKNEKIRCRHNKCGYRYSVTPSNFLKGRRCPKCSNRINKGREEIENQIKNLYQEEYVLIKYTKTTEPIQIKHSKCGNEYCTNLYNLLKGHGCPTCNGGIKKSNFDFLEQVKKQVEEEYFFEEEYIDFKTKIKCVHRECGHTWKVSPNNFLKGRRCPQCKSSLGEKKIQSVLKKFNVEFLTEHKFRDCVYKRELPFDFYLKESRILIEYDGEQHFKPIRGWGGVDKLDEVRARDIIKNDYCHDNNIPLLRIPYWKYDEIEHILFDFLVKHGVIEEL